MSRRSTSPHREEGVALFYALLVTLIVGGIVAVVFATAITENRQAALELDFEDTVHVAEAGAEQLLQELAEDSSFNSGVAGPGAGDPAQWAVTEALRKDAGGNFIHNDPLDLGEGESIALRPNDDDAEFIYGVGFTPSRQAFDDGIGDPYVRVVRVQVAFTPSAFAADVALLAGGNLKMSGNFDISGTNGAVHTNGAIEIAGSSGSVSKGVSYSGSCTKGCSGSGSVAVSGPVDPEPVPEVDILDTWNTNAARVAAAAGEWYDHCAGVWYQRNELDTAPCQGDQLGGTVPFPADWPWAGTSFEGVDGGSSVTGTYFFRDDVDLDVKRPNGSITFITGGDITVGPSANAPTLDGHLPGIFMLADGDINLKANFDAAELDSPAVIMSNKTLVFNGNPDTVNVAFIARDELRAGSTYKGTGTVMYDGGALPDFGGGGFPVVVQWDEVRAP